MKKAKTQIKTNIKFDTKEFDPLGLKPVGQSVSKSIDKVTDASIKSVKSFLSVTCKPLFEELGLLMRDKISAYRLKNLIKVLEKAKGKLIYDPEKQQLSIHPRLAYQIVEHASMVDDDDLQEMWGGLFASSCNDQQDDGNIIFIDILKQLTGSQVRFLHYLCNASSKSINVAKLPEHRKIGLMRAEILSLSIDKISHILQTSDYSKISIEINSLDNLGLAVIQGGFPRLEAPFERQGLIRVMPSFFSLQLFVKCLGTPVDPLHYFLPEIYADFLAKTKNKVELKVEEFLDFLMEKYKLQEKYGVFLVNRNNENAFLKVDLIFSELDQLAASGILLAHAICNWQKFDFETTYPVKERTKNKYDKVEDRHIGMFSIQAGFEKKLRQS